MPGDYCLEFWRSCVQENFSMEFSRGKKNLLTTIKTSQFRMLHEFADSLCFTLNTFGTAEVVQLVEGWLGGVQVGCGWVLVCLVCWLFFCLFVCF